MTDETQKSPFTDTGVAQGVMSTMPILSGLKPVKVKKNAVESSLKTTDKDLVYPFGFKVIRKTIKANNDGIYLYYDIYDGTEWVGFFDYYYNWNTKKFSYKQMVNVTIVHDDTSFAFIEFNDVDIKDFDTNKPKFAVGQVKNGVFEKNAFFSMFTFNRYSTTNDSATAGFQLSYVTAKSDGKMMASIFRTDESYDTHFSDLEGDSDRNFGLQTIHNAYKTYFSTTTDTRTLSMDQFFSILESGNYITDLKDIKDHISKGSLDSSSDDYYAKGYSSYEEYCRWSFGKGFVQNLQTNAQREYNRLVHDMASVYTFTNKKSASTQFSYKLYHHMEPTTCDCIYCTSRHHDGGRPTLINISNDKEEVDLINGTDLSGLGIMGCTAPYNMFEDIYKTNIGLVESTDPDRYEKVHAYMYTVATAHMKACGLSDTDAENYAKNFVYSELKISEGDGTIHYIPITVMDHEQFKALFDQENGI